jgi:hypothetical protein
MQTDNAIPRFMRTSAQALVRAPVEFSLRGLSQMVWNRLASPVFPLAYIVRHGRIECSLALNSLCQFL